jgi:hypothetical protein
VSVRRTRSNAIGGDETKETNVRSTRRTVAVAAGAIALVTALSGFRYSGFDDPAARAAAASGTAYLKSRQLPGGSFETAGFPGFETPDAILAIAEDAQTAPTWSRKQARDAVYAQETAFGNSVLHATDDFADGGINAGQAAKLVILVTRPLGLSSTSFNPDRDAPVDLQAIIDAGHQPDGSYGAFNATLYAAIAKRTLGGVPADTVAYIKHAQQANGGWDFAGDPTGKTAIADVDTTALAIQALVSSGVGRGDPHLRAALGFLARRQRAVGAWQAFGTNDPNSTAVAMIAITAAGYDPTDSCWRDKAMPSFAGRPYRSPVTWLRGDQLPSGRFKSPNDQFGINTSPTSQAIQALRRGWLPVNALPPQDCS